MRGMRGMREMRGMRGMLSDEGDVSLWKKGFMPDLVESRAGTKY